MDDWKDKIELPSDDEYSKFVENINRFSDNKMKRLIENLTKQLQKVIKEHPIDVENDTYWRGVMIGLKTAIEVARTVKK